MAWNEPGGNNRDPWSGGGNQGPPDLDEVLRKVRNRINGLFGRRGGGGNGGGGGLPGGGMNAAGIGVIVAIGAIVWLASGFYIIEEGQRGVETRFGALTDTTAPGPHWHLPFPVEAVQKVDVKSIRRITIGYDAVSPEDVRIVPSEALMLTEDENIVNVQLAVQYQVSDAGKFLFNFVFPEQTLKEVTESALREVVGKRDLDYVLTEGRAEVSERTRELVQKVLDNYDVGIRLVEMVVQDIQPPEPVQGAFLDAIKAREDKQRLINQAEGYRNEVIPKAQGEAARIREQAQGYREQVIADAQGDASRFTQLEKEFSRAPVVTRERLYLDTIEEVLAGSSKILVDMPKNGQQPMMYLPIERLMRQSASDGADAGSDQSVRYEDLNTSSVPSSQSQSSQDRRSNRTRESR